MSRFIVTAPVLALAATAAPAYAQDMSWTGFYVGVHGAFVDTKPTWTGHNIYQTVVDGGEGNLTLMPHDDTITARGHHTDPGGGGRVGFNFASGGFVIGGEADATFFGYTRNITNTSASATYTLHSHASSLETVRARAGVAFGPAMLFATGGVAFSNLRNTLTATDMSQVIVDGGEGASTIGPATANLADSRKVNTGWTVGGGGEVRVSNKFSIALTLLHVDFGHDNLAAASAPSSFTARVKSRMFVGMLGVNLGF
ncbi:MAG TPA: outer membrane beta-barrel protein [Croceibacterium sp.]|jgi:outer membrane immunogenic protein